jgi:hypothetical protein
MLNKVKSSIAVSPIMREKTQVKHLKITSPFPEDHITFP